MNQRMEALMTEGQGLIDTARLEGRTRTPEEEHRLVDVMAEMKQLRGTQAEVDGFLHGAEKIEELSPSGPVGSGRLGDFIHSEGYKKIQSSSSRGQTWSSGAVPIATKGTLLEGSTAGTLVPAEYQAGIVSKLAQPIGLADYFGQEQTTASHVRYVNEGTATSA